MSKNQIKPLTGRSIDAMTDAQRAKLIEDLESKTPEQHLAESRPLTEAQRRRFDGFVMARLTTGARRGQKAEEACGLAGLSPDFMAFSASSAALR